MLVIPQDAPLRKVKDLFSTQTAFSATRPAKKLNKQADGQQNKYPDLNMMGVLQFPKLQRNEKILKCCEGSRVMFYMPVRLNTTEAAELCT